ncbi:MAG: hypothetical protein A2Y71_03765 [Bacteroidetes bacterium RBG_13_42_15]|nr:MAG: hypothetical protein A2Y71_03765 [Bacteroidetes bacterium RBG_13_42_15]
MSELEFIDEIRKLKGQIMSRVISTVIASLLIMIIGGGVAMAKVYNVKGKADKTYVDAFFKDIVTLSATMENRTIILEGMIKANKERDDEKYDALAEKLKEMDIRWQEHMKYHMERTRGVAETSTLIK